MLGSVEGIAKASFEDTLRAQSVGDLLSQISRLSEAFYESARATTREGEDVAGELKSNAEEFKAAIDQLIDQWASAGVAEPVLDEATKRRDSMLPIKKIDKPKTRQEVVDVATSIAEGFMKVMPEYYKGDLALARYHAWVAYPRLVELYNETPGGITKLNDDGMNPVDLVQKHEGSAYHELNDKVNAEVLKDPSLSREAAFVKACRENPELNERAGAEQRARLRNR